MKIKTILFCFALIAPLSAPIGVSSAAGRLDCQSNPDRCEQLQKRLKARCEAQPEECERMKARVEQFRQKCDADPAACERKKEALKQKADALAAECADDPATCEQKKKALRERLEQKKRANPPAGETPPIVPPVPQQ